MKRIIPLILILFTVVFVATRKSEATTRLAEIPQKTLTRATFIKTLVEALFEKNEIETCDTKKIPFRDVSKNQDFAKYICVAWEKGITGQKSSFRPNNEITLAEAAVFFVKAFKLPLEKVETEAKWYKSYLLTLANENAIPITFWSHEEKVTKSEMAEMLSRLKEKIWNRPMLAYQALEDFQRYNKPADHHDFLRLYGDFQKSLSGSLFTAQHLQKLLEPASYQILDQKGDEYDGTVYCQRFAADSISVIHSADFSDFKVTFEGVSTDYCDYPYTDMAPGTCPPDAKYADDPRCNIGKARPYTLTLEKRGEELRVLGAESDRIKIIRQPLWPLCIVWTSEACPQFYEHTKVETEGTLTEAKLPSGEKIQVYRTPWKSIFGDLRGIPFLKVSREQDDFKIFTAIYYDPKHNREHYGSLSTSYDQCFKEPIAKFCIKKEGGNFVLGSRFPLGNRVTLWIDEHFRR